MGIGGLIHDGIERFHAGGGWAYRCDSRSVQLESSQPRRNPSSPVWALSVFHNGDLIVSLDDEERTSGLVTMVEVFASAIERERDTSRNSITPRNI